MKTTITVNKKKGKNANTPTTPSPQGRGPTVRAASGMAPEERLEAKAGEGVRTAHARATPPATAIKKTEENQINGQNAPTVICSAKGTSDATEEEALTTPSRASSMTQSDETL